MAPAVAVAAVAAMEFLSLARLAVRVEGRTASRARPGVAAVVQAPAERRQQAVRAELAPAAPDRPAQLAVSLRITAIRERFSPAGPIASTDASG